MSSTITTSNMGMPLPIPGSTSGPEYAYDNNASLTIIDSHDHSSGKGVQVTPAGLDINSSLPFQGNDAVSLRSTRYQAQASPLASGLDLGCTYVSGVDLYFNDENGNQIQITKDGSIAGTSGSIAGLTSPASATFATLSGTFVWQSDALVPATMDAGTYILRKTSASSPGISLTAPTSLSSSYSLTLPPTVAATSRSFITEDTSGNLSNATTLDGTTLKVTSNVVSVDSLALSGITSAQLSPTADILGSQLSASADILGTQLDPSADILLTQLALVNIHHSATVTGSSSSTSFTNIGSMHADITLTGVRPVRVWMQPTVTLVGLQGLFSTHTTGSFDGRVTIQIIRQDGATWNTVMGTDNQPTINNSNLPVSVIDFVDIAPIAGANTYSFQVATNTTNCTFTMSNSVLFVQEL